MRQKPLKILYAASTAAHLRSFHLPYLKALTDRGHAVTAAAAGDGDGLPAGVTFFPVPFQKSMTSPQNLRCAGRLAALMRREHFDVAVTHTSLAAFFTRLGVMMAGRGQTRVVNTVHGYLFDDDTPAPRRQILLSAEKFAAPVTDDILVMNAQDEAIARTYKLCRGRIARIDGMGFPLDRYAPATAAERRAARARLDLPEDAFVLLYAAEFSRRKSHEFLLDALATLPEDVFLLLPGDGALLEQCRTRAGERGIARRTHFPGHVADIRPYLQAADVCVSPSRSEGLPFHVLEAMGSGLPSVLTRVKGHEDLLEGGKAGLLVPYGDALAMALAVDALRQDGGLRADMGRAARVRAQKYDLRRVMPTVLPWYTLEKQEEYP